MGMAVDYMGGNQQNSCMTQAEQHSHLRLMLSLVTRPLLTHWWASRGLDTRLAYAVPAGSCNYYVHVVGVCRFFMCTYMSITLFFMCI